VAFSPNGKMLATAGIGGSARLWDVVTRREIGAAMTPGGGPVLAVAVSPNGKLLATTDNGGSARFWSVATQRQIGKRVGGQGAFAVQFKADSKLLATVGFSLRVWSVATQRAIGT